MAMRRAVEADEAVEADLQLAISDARQLDEAECDTRGVLNVFRYEYEYGI